MHAATSLLDVMQGYLGLNRTQMLHEINANFSMLLEILKIKRHRLRFL